MLKSPSLRAFRQKLITEVSTCISSVSETTSHFCQIWSCTLFDSKVIVFAISSCIPITFDLHFPLQNNFARFSSFFLVNPHSLLLFQTFFCCSFVYLHLLRTVIYRSLRREKLQPDEPLLLVLPLETASPIVPFPIQQFQNEQLHFARHRAIVSVAPEVLRRILLVVDAGHRETD